MEVMDPAGTLQSTPIFSASAVATAVSSVMVTASGVRYRRPLAGVYTAVPTGIMVPLVPVKVTSVRAREHDREEAGQELGVLPKSIGDLTDEDVGIAPLTGVDIHSAGCQSGQNFWLNDFRRTALKYG